MHARTVLALLLTFAACGNDKPAPTTAPAAAEPAKAVAESSTEARCTRAIDHFVDLLVAAQPKTSASECDMMPTSALECQIAATTMAALTDCFKQAASAQINVTPGAQGGPNTAKLALCQRADNNARALMKETLSAARTPRIQQCVAGNAAHVDCQISAATPQAWAACDPGFAAAAN